MSLNFDGLGMELEVNDNKSSEIIDNLTGSVGKLWDKLKVAGSVTGKAARGIGSSMGRLGESAQRGAGMAVAGVAAVIASAQNPEFDNAFSSQFAQINKDAKMMSVGLRGAQKENEKTLKKVGSVAFGMNADSDAAMSLTKRMMQGGVDMVKFFGGGSIDKASKKMIAFINVFKVDGEKFADTVSGMAKSWGYSEKEASKLYDQVFTIGKAYGIGAEAIGSMDQMQTQLNESMANYMVGMNPEEKRATINELTKSMTQLGGSLAVGLGMDPKAAMDASMNLVKVMSEEKDSLLKMTAGMGGEFGDLARQLMESTGNPQETVKALTDLNPAKLMAMLGEMGKSAEESGMKGSAGYMRLNEAIKGIDPNLAYAMQNTLGKEAESIGKTLPAALENAEGAINKASKKAYSSGMTLGDQWQRMVDMYKARVKGLTQVNAAQWMKKQNKAFGETIQNLTILSKKDGPVGAFTRALIDSQTYGLAAFIPGLSSIAPLLGGIASSALPAATALGTLGLRFSHIGKAILIGGPLMLLFKILSDGPEKTRKNIDAMIRDIGPKLKDFWRGFQYVSYVLIENFKLLAPKITESLDSIDWGGFSDKIVGFIDNIPFGKIVDVLSSLFGAALNGISSMVNTIGKKIDFGAIGRKIAEFISNINFSSIFKKVFGIASGLSRIIGDLVGGLFKGIEWYKLFSNIVDTLATVLVGAGGMLASLLSSIFSSKENGKIVEAGMGGMLSSALIGAVVFAGKTIAGMATGLWTGIIDKDSAGESFRNFGKFLLAGFAGFMIISKKFRIGFMNMTTNMVKATCSKEIALLKSHRSRVSKLINTGFSKGKAFAGKIAGSAIALGMFAMAAAEGAKKAGELYGEIDKLDSNFDKMALKGGAAFTGVMTGIDSLLFGLPSSIGSAIGISEQDLDNFYYFLVSGTENAINATVETFSWLWDTIKSGANLLLGWFKFGYKEMFWENFVALGSLIVNSFSSVWDRMKYLAFTFISWIKEKFVSLGSAIAYPFEYLAHNLKGLFLEIKGMILELASNPVVSKILKTFGIDEKVVNEWRVKQKEDRKEWELAGGLDNFDKVRQEELDKKLKVYQDERANLEKEYEKIDNFAKTKEFGVNTTELESDAKGFVNQVTDKAVNTINKIGKYNDQSNAEAAKRADQSAEYKETVKKRNEYNERDIQPSESAKKAAEEARKENQRKRKSEMKEPMTGSELRQEQKEIYSGATDPVTRGLVDNVSNLAGAMTEFTKKPLTANVSITGDIAKFFRAVTTEERKTATVSSR